MTGELPFDSLNPKLLDRFVARQLGLKSKIGTTGAQSLAQHILIQVAAKHATSVDSPFKSPPNFRIEALARALLDEDESASSAFISKLQEIGTSPKEIYLSYLAEAARVLGKWWDEDRVSFVEVTIGASRIYGILRAIDGSFVPRGLGTSKRALFVSPASEDHMLGVKMASDLFRQNGWNIELMLGESEKAILERILHANHIIVGLSSAGTHSITELAKLVLAIRIHHPDVYILISGNVLEEHQETVEAMHPDAMVMDFNSALERLEKFWYRSTGKET